MSQRRSALLPGIITGLPVMLAGAALYGALIGLTQYEIGLATIGLGALTGLGVTPTRASRTTGPLLPLLPPLAALLGLTGAALGQVAGTALLLMDHAGQQGLPMTYATAAAEIVTGFNALIGESPESILYWAASAITACTVAIRRTTGTASRHARTHATATAATHPRIAQSVTAPNSPSTPTT
ncbi:hypothetical protein GCM10022419_107440 [Nonomuraea rosea]|uniref:Uncharacterized protein n=1 Tax=Nonomuraea rosea TaxID=638574 RepID=A0ABP6ZEI6_9ACTN